MSKKFWRTRLLVYPKYQLVLMMVTSFSLVCALGIVAFYFNSLANELLTKVKLPESDLKLMVQFVDQFYDSLLYAGIGGFLSVWFFSLFTSHKVVGPFIRLRNYFTDINEGRDPGKLTFRDGDFFRDLPPLVESAMQKSKHLADPQSISMNEPIVIANPMESTNELPNKSKKLSADESNNRVSASSTLSVSEMLVTASVHAINVVSIEKEEPSLVMTISPAKDLEMEGKRDESYSKSAKDVHLPNEPVKKRAA